MTTEPMTFEIVPEELGISAPAKVELESAFVGFFQQAEQWKIQTANITDPKMARAARLQLKTIRVEAEKTHKRLKEDSLRYGRAVDGAKNILLAVLVPIEKQMEDIEKAEERRLQAERAQRIADRTELLRPYIEADMPLPPVGDMTSEQFEKVLEDAKFLHQARLEAAAKREAERIEREKKEAEERERIRIENERLKREAAEREEAARKEREAAAAQLAKERAEAEARAKAEREKVEAEMRKQREEAAKKEAEAAAKAKAEAEARAKAEAEARRLREAEEARQRAEAEAKAAAELAARKAAQAPDKERALRFAATVRAITIEGMKTDAGKAVAAEIQSKIEDFAAWIERKAEKL